MEAAISIERGMAVLTWLAAALILIPMSVVILELAGALFWRSRENHSAPIQSFPSTVVLIPAHNEEAGISRTLASVFIDIPQNFRVLCVAHNCSDGTARVARQMGAEILEVRDDGQGGKPNAIKAGLRWLDAHPPEVVVVIDADCSVSVGTVRTLAGAAHTLRHPVMGVYRFAAADAGRGLSMLSSLALLLKNFVRPLGLHAWGLPCLLNGSGSAYPYPLIRNAPHGEGSIAEDYQLTIDLMRQGHPTTFVPEAQIYGHLPSRQATALRQRNRWEHGHLYLAFRAAPRLFLEGLFQLDRNRMALALEVSVPPLAFLGLTWVGGFALSLTLLLIVGDAYPFWVLIGVGFMFVLSILIAWMRFAGVAQTLQALASAPRYLMWKLPLYRNFFIRRETRWIKTDRN